MSGVAVVGSGLSGTFCALALARRGARVHMLDVGETLDQERAQAVEFAAQTPVSDWNSALRTRLGVGAVRNWGHGIPVKLAFGSAYAYGFDAPHSPVDGAPDAIPPSFAKGGYSTVWGGTMLPYNDADLADWPLTAADLAPYYRAVLAHLPLTAGDDALAEAFPMYKEPSEIGTPTLGPQMDAVLDDLRRASTALARDGVLAGFARLAVRSADRGGERACVDCGLCLTGCPTGAIYASPQTLDPLVASGAVEYHRGCVVRTVQENGREVRLTWSDPATGAGSSASFDRVFLAAGALSTTRIMLESLAATDLRVTLRESQKFLVPLLRFAGAPGALDDTTMRLSGAFLEIADRTGGGRWIHVQLSPVNNLVLRRLRLDPERLSRPAKRLLEPALSRLIFAWGGLHSTDSPALNLRLDRSAEGGPPRLKLEAVEGITDPRPAMRRLSRILWRHARRLRAAPLTPLTVLPKPGGGHYGGTFPMRRSPLTVTETDLLGRPGGFQRVHLVDSSVFPSIPATTISLTTMTNAFRIGMTAEIY